MQGSPQAICQSNPTFNFSLFHNLPDNMGDKEEGDEDDDDVDVSDKEDSKKKETCATCLWLTK
jgi:hypothetical protein